jgi:hypothetical protein
MFVNVTPKQFQKLREIFELEGVRPLATLQGEALTLLSRAAAENGGEIDLDRIGGGEHVEIRVVARFA